MTIPQALRLNGKVHLSPWKSGSIVGPGGRRAEGATLTAVGAFDFALSCQSWATCVLMARLYARRYRKAKR